jgi:hypothetical protein
LFAAAASCIVATAPTAPAVAAQRAVRLAPADEYFGPLKISILGIRNITRDQGARYAADSSPTTATAVLGMMANVELAIKDLEKKYPQDTALPGSIYRLERLYASISTGPAIEKAQATEKWLFTRYPNAPQAKQLRSELAAHPLQLPAAGSTASEPVSPAAGAPAAQTVK